MRLIFVNRFYWPETPATGQLLTDLAEGLAARGHDITVITSGDRAARAEEIHEGVRIHRILAIRRSGSALAGKALDFAGFFFRALARAHRLADRETTIVSLTDPPLIGVGLWLVARLRGARLIHWIQDIYPELAIELAGASWLRLLRPLRNAAWRAAAHCVTLGDDMRSCVAAMGVEETHLAVIPNWAPAGLAATPLRTEWGLDGKFVIAYSGNLGRVHDLEAVLDLAALLRTEPAIAFVFIGEGAQRDQLQAEGRRRGLENVSFQPPQPRARLAETLSTGDLHLVTLRPGCERLVFPSKLYGIVAVGRPVLFIGPAQCEIARLVVSQRFGLAATREELSRLAERIRELRRDPTGMQGYADAARDFAARNSVDVAVARWSELLTSCEVGLPPATPTSPVALR